MSRAEERMGSVLLVSTIEGEHGLLHEGAHGVTPPKVYSGSVCAYRDHRAWADTWHHDCYMCRYPTEALVLAWNGVGVVEGCDRTLRAIHPLRLAEQKRHETRAKAVYEAWPEAAGHPWTPGGNSEKQDEARRQAGLQEGFAQWLSLAYTLEEARRIATEGARLGLGQVVLENTP